MKLLRVGELGSEIVAALDKDDKIRDLSEHIDDLDPKSLNNETLTKLKQIDLSSLNEIDAKKRVGSCVTNPIDFLAIGLNYRSHILGSKSKEPKEPIVFNKSCGSIQGPYDPIKKPNSAKKMDFECEICVVISKEGKYIKESEAQDYVFGYCIVNDISERSWQKDRGGQWIKGKSIAGPTGPLLVTKDEIKDIKNINFTLDLNGERKQAGNTKNMIFDFNYLISYISQFFTLYPGHLITTGTSEGTLFESENPIFLKAGDKLCLKADFLGEQKCEVINE